MIIVVTAISMWRADQAKKIHLYADKKLKINTQNRSSLVQLSSHIHTDIVLSDGVSESALIIPWSEPPGRVMGDIVRRNLEDTIPVAIRLVMD